MTSSRRKSPMEFSLPVEETAEAIEETTAEVVEEVVEEETKEEVVAEVKQPLATVQISLTNNPKPVVPRNSSRRNTPRFSAQR